MKTPSALWSTMGLFCPSACDEGFQGAPIYADESPKPNDAEHAPFDQATDVPFAARQQPCCIPDSEQSVGSVAVMKRRRWTDSHSMDSGSTRMASPALAVYSESMTTQGVNGGVSVSSVRALIRYLLAFELSSLRICSAAALPFAVK